MNYKFYNDQSGNISSINYVDTNQFIPLDPANREFIKDVAEQGYDIV